MTRLERAGIVREYYLKQLDDNEKEFVKFVLKTYETEGENVSSYHFSEHLPRTFFVSTEGLGVGSR
jgi:hypothetical protein